MKIAISGKGGVGKTTIASILSLMLAEQGEKVLALDADPDANLASALGMPSDEQERIVSIGQRMDLIEERTGAKAGTFGQMFNLNPDVSDIAENYATPYRGIALLVLGAARTGGGGCACPESAFIKALVDDLVLNKDETLLMDMEAGLEHLGRATAQSVDVLLVVVEPGVRSVGCALDIERMAHDIGLTNLLYIGSKVSGPDDEAYIRTELGERPLATCLPMSEGIRLADRAGQCAYDALDDVERARYTTLLDAIRATAK